MKLRFGSSAGVPNMLKHIKSYKIAVKQELSEIVSIIDFLQRSEETMDNDPRIISALFLKHLKECSLIWCDESLGIPEKWKNQEPDTVFNGNTSLGDHKDMDLNVVNVPARDLPLME